MNIKKILLGSAAGVLMFGSLAVGAFAAVPNWNLTGSHTLTFTCVTGCSGDWVHTMNINNMNMTTGDFSGTGFFNPDDTYTWDVTGNVDGSNITFNVHYTGTAAGSEVYQTGTIDLLGNASGTSTSNFGPTFTWTLSQLTTPRCTKTEFFRDGINMTAALFNPAGTVTGDVNATGCNIGVYYGPGKTGGLVDHANIYGANYYGVVVQQADVDVINSNIHNIGDVPFNGSQHGVGVYYANVDGESNGDCTTESGLTSGSVDSNNVSLYQKGGVVVVCKGTNVSVTNNTVTGLGPVDFIAQNGIQFGYGAKGIASGNTIDGGNEYTGTGWTSTGLLLFDVNAKDVKTSNNKFIHNQTNLAVVTAQACSKMYGGFYGTYGLCLFP